MENEPEIVDGSGKFVDINKLYQDLLNNNKFANVSLSVKHGKTTLFADNVKFEIDTNIDIILPDEQITLPNHSFKKVEDYEELLSSPAIDKSLTISKLDKMIKDFVSENKFNKSFTLENGKLDSSMSNDNWIVANTDSPEEENKICKNEDNGFFVPINAESGMSIRYFINNDPRIPEGKVYYDYFGCGELFVNIPKDRCITGLSPYFKNIMNAYFLRENAELRGIVPTEHNVAYTPHVASTISPIADPGQSLYGWMFILDECFTVSDRPNVQIDETVNPICKYYSYASEEKVLAASPFYNFANHIPEFPSCACVEKTGKQNTVMGCDFYVARQSKCAFYLPNSNNVVDVNITPKNSSITINMKLDHFVDAVGRNVFDIVNLTDGNRINQLRIPSEISYEDAVVEAKKIFEEYTTCYTDHSFDENKSQDDRIEKKSFIQTLVEV